LSGQFQVGEDGKVLLPLVGLVAVADQPFEQLQRRITELYQSELQEPVLRLVPLQRIAVLGEVRMPGLYPLDPTATLADAIAAAGGLSPLARRSRIQLVRGEAVTRASLDPGSEGLRLKVRSGDQIIVGRRSWLSDNAGVLLGLLGSVAAAAVTSLVLR
jgi:polysaccharide export outer membrane protein